MGEGCLHSTNRYYTFDKLYEMEDVLKNNIKMNDHVKVKGINFTEFSENNKCTSKCKSVKLKQIFFCSIICKTPLFNLKLHTKIIK